MPVKAPFRFARINRWIYEPAWAGLVSHDVPFSDGLSGEAEVEITATSSILVGGDRRRAAADRQGEVRPFRLPDGTYAIPGSALQGMARAVLEIAGFGRLGPWVQDRKFGMAFAFKAAHTKSTYDLLANSCPGHVETVADMKLDLPHLIFGVAAEHGGGRGLKRRARFGLARADGSPKEHRPRNPSVLLGPKPGYAGIYVRQRYDNKQAPREPLATYTPYKSPQAYLARPELSGVKIWPARHQGNEPFDPGPVSPNPAENLNVQTDLVTLPPGTVFQSRLAFHNLLPVELGALLWVLSFGDPAAFGDDPKKVTKRHRLGMGKPLGLGEVAIRVTGLLADPAHCPEGVYSTDSPNAAELARAFEEHMEQAEAYGPQWRQSKQVQALLKAAAPGSSGNLEYMVLDAFRDATKNGQYLSDYAPDGSHEKPRDASSSRRADRVTSAPPAAELPLAVGSTVRVNPGAPKELRNREALLVHIGDGPNPQCTVQFTDNKKEERLRESQFVIVAPPPC